MTSDDKLNLLGIGVILIGLFVIYRASVDEFEIRDALAFEAGYERIAGVGK